MAPAGPSCPAVLPGWTTPGDGLDGFHTKVLVGVNGDRPLWRGQPIGWGELAKRLKLATDPAIQPETYILFDPTGASDCGAATRIRDTIERVAGCAKRGYCGQGTTADFKRQRSTDPRKPLAD